MRLHDRERELTEEASRQSAEAQQRQQLERQKSEWNKREASERHGAEVEGLKKRVADLQSASEGRAQSLLARLDASEHALAASNAANTRGLPFSGTSPSMRRALT